MKTVTMGAAAALALLLAACDAPAPREQYFTLSTPNPGAAPPASATPSVFVGPVAVPEAVDRTQMVLRTAPNQVDVADDYRWAEPLRNAIPRVIAETLSRELGSSRVLASRLAAGTKVDYRVAIEVQRFDSSLDQGATIDALWTVTGNADGRSRNGRSVVHEALAARDPGAVAAAHSRALERVARDIAAAIRALAAGER
jgi:hypothetical protein